MHFFFPKKIYLLDSLKINMVKIGNDNIGNNKKKERYAIKKNINYKRV